MVFAVVLAGLAPSGGLSYRGSSSGDAAPICPTLARVTPWAGLGAPPAPPTPTVERARRVWLVVGDLVKRVVPVPAEKGSGRVCLDGHSRLGGGGRLIQIP